MALTVEDGRCPDFANSYVSLEDADRYLTGRGIWPETPLVEKPEQDGSEDAESAIDEEDATAADAGLVKDKEAALIRAFDFLNMLKWKGRKPCWERLAAWPRDNVPVPGSDPVEYIEPDCVPRLVVQAQCELAALIYNGYGPFAPREHGGRVKSESNSSTETVDVLTESKSHSVAYADDAPTEAWLSSVYPLLAPFLEEVPGEAQCGLSFFRVRTE